MTTVVTSLDDNGDVVDDTSDVKIRKKMKRSRWCVACLGDLIVELAPELRELILGKLDLLGYHCFSAVCKSWRSIAIEARLHEESKKEKLIINYFPFRPRHHHQLPYLMFPSLSNKESRQLCFILSHLKLFRLELPEFRGGRCVGSSLGWLIMTSEKGDNYLLNPASRVQIQLPNLDSVANFTDTTGTFGNEAIFNSLDGWWLRSPWFIRKAILFEAVTTTKMITGSKNDENGINCNVVAIYKEKSLVFCRPIRRDDDQQICWTAIEYDHNPRKKSDFEGIIFYNGQLYAVCDDFSLVKVIFPDDHYLAAASSSHPNPIRATKCNIPPPSAKNYNRPSLSRSERRYIYLVESIGGELLMVIRHYELIGCQVPQTIGFEIFKLDIRIPGWVEVESLGNQMLFLGTSHGVSLSAAEFPKFRGNHIFFTEDGPCDRGCLVFFINKPSRDIGVFSLESKSVMPMPFFPDFYQSSALSPPFWFTPNPW